MANRVPSYLVGNMFHGTQVGAARLISGLRVDRAKEEPVIRTSFNTLGRTSTTNYPRRFGPGMYLTDNFSDAHHFARGEHNDSKVGAIVEGAVKPDNPIHLTEDEFDEIAISKSSQNISEKIAKKYPEYRFAVGSPNRVSPEKSEGPRLDVIKAKNFSEMDERFKNYFTNYTGAHDLNLPYIKNERIITGADRTAANINLRQGHDYLHITDHTPIFGNSRAQYGVVLRPSSRGIDAAFKARKVHFLEGIHSGKVEEL